MEKTFDKTEDGKLQVTKSETTVYDLKKLKQHRAFLQALKNAEVPSYDKQLIEIDEMISEAERLGVKEVGK